MNSRPREGSAYRIQFSHSALGILNNNSSPHQSHLILSRFIVKCTDIQDLVVNIDRPNIVHPGKIISALVGCLQTKKIAKYYLFTYYRQGLKNTFFIQGRVLDGYKKES